MTIVDQAIWIIERNSAASLTLPGIAEACGVSRSQLANAFGHRDRRAGDALRAGAATRRRPRGCWPRAPATSSRRPWTPATGRTKRSRGLPRSFGRTPEQVRARGSLDGLPLVEPVTSSMPRPAAAGRAAVRARRHAARRRTRRGLLVRTTLTIPAQWQRFMALVDAIPARLDRIPVGVSEVADDDGGFRYVCGVEVARFERDAGQLDRAGDRPARVRGVRASWPRRDDLRHLRGDLEPGAAGHRPVSRERADRRTPQPGLRSTDGRRRLSLWIPLETVR